MGSYLSNENGRFYTKFNILCNLPPMWTPYLSKMPKGSTGVADD